MFPGRGRGIGRRGRAAEQDRGAGPVGKVIQGVAAGIGLAAETYYHQKDKKKTKKADQQQQEAEGTLQPHESSSATAHIDESEDAGSPRPQQTDEAMWELDEAQQEAVPSVQDRSGNTTSLEGLPRPGGMQQAVGEADGETATPTAPRELALPVILTQRRPGTRIRGFVRAYAPVLADAGVSQDAFLAFLDGLDEAVRPSPLIEAINLAGLAGLAVPEPFTFLISLAATTATKMAAGVHSRSKTNTYLDGRNREFFMPRGLLVLVMTWRPARAGEVLTEVDLDGGLALAGTAGAQANPFRKVERNLQASSGTSGFEWPETAPLVFPGLDEVAVAAVAAASTDPAEPEAKDGKGKKKGQESALKRGRKFVDEYMDKRARAKWAGEHPESAMANAGPPETFRSRFADPNHPASSGGLVPLLTGGQPVRPSTGRPQGVAGRDEALDARDRLGSLGEENRGQGRILLGPRGELLRGRRKGAFDRPLSQAGAGPAGRGYRGQGPDRGSQPDPRARGLGGYGPLSLLSGVRKVLQQDVLYLMIVNMPSLEQMAAASEMLENIDVLGHTYD